MQLQYNFEEPFNASGEQVFNPYTRFIHGKLEDGNLDASAYAFSIDDHESVQNYSGDGLLFAVGGGRGLPNQTKIPRAVPQHYDWYTARVQLGIDKTKPVKYKSYGVCNQVADKDFPPAAETGTIGLDPRMMSRKLPCTITLKDTNNVVYQVTVKQANATGSLPYQIWPAFNPSAGKNFDSTVLSCNAPTAWCANVIENAAPGSDPNTRPNYTITVPIPLQ
jgi:hypothetical protein